MDAAAGVVSVLDELTLEPVGEPIELGSPVMQSVVDGDCTVFSLLDDGTVVPIGTNGTVGASFRVAGSGDAAALSVVDGTAVVVDEADPSVAPLTSDGPGDRIGLDIPAGDLKVPAAASGSLPVLSEDGAVAVVEPSTGSVRYVTLPEQDGADLGAPVVNGDLLYVPDFSSGKTLVIGVAGGTLEDVIDVSDGEFELFVDDRIVFANDAQGNGAVVVDDTGAVRHVTKYDEEVAANAEQPVETPEKLTPIPQSPQEERDSEFPSLVDQPEPGESEFPALVDPPPAPGPPGNPGPPSDPAPGDPGATEPGPPTEVPVPGPAGPTGPPGDPPAPPEPPAPPPAPVDACPDVPGEQPPGTDCTPAPNAPGQPAITGASAADLAATVDFAPGSGGQVDSYRLRVVENGNDIQPKDVQGNGQNRFTVSFADCKTVQFAVVAVGPGGESSSPLSQAVTTCQAAGQVDNLRVVDKETTADKITMTWKPPSGTGPFIYEVWGFGQGRAQTDQTSFRASGLKADTSYDFRVVAIGPGGAGPEASTRGRTNPPPKPPTDTIRECRDGKELPGGGHRAFYDETCSQGSPTGRTFQVLSGPYAGYEPLYRYSRLVQRDPSYMNEFYLKTGGPPDGSWGNGKVIGYVGGGNGPQIKAHRWDHWDGSYSWKAWSFGTSWPGFQPGAANRATVDPVFRAE